MMARQVLEADLLIVGASVRAAAQSAIRAGYRPCAIDLFCDEDLLSCCLALQCQDYPAGLAKSAALFPRMRWLYTGALENYPELVDRLAAGRPLLGNSGEILRRVRDPLGVAQSLRSAGIDAPECQLSHQGLPTDGSWLRKPLRSAGGARIAPWTGQMTGERSDCYFQKRIDGTPCAAIYVAASGQSQLLGVTQQVVGANWARAKGFQYVGSIGPLALSESIRGQFERIGNSLSRQYQLSGLFGVDAIMSSDSVYPVEVNPRYTASVEVLERALGMQSLRLHVEACQHKRLSTLPNSAATSIAGKAILYAKDSVVIGAQFSDLVRSSNDESAWPTIADIPARATRISAGRPIATVFTSSDSVEGTTAGLQEQVAAVERILY